MEHGASEVIKWIIMTITIAFILTVGTMVYRIGRLSSYQQSINQILQANGGLTTNAQQKIDKVSEKYHGNFEVKSRNNVSNTAQGFGKTIDYTIHTKIPIASFASSGNSKTVSVHHTMFETDFNGATTSQIGKD